MPEVVKQTSWLWLLSLFIEIRNRIPFPNPEYPLRAEEHPQPGFSFALLLLQTLNKSR